MAFDPNYGSNGRFYVFYTNTSGNLVIARFQRSAGDPDLAILPQRQSFKPSIIQSRRITTAACSPLGRMAVSTRVSVTEGSR